MGPWCTTLIPTFNGARYLPALISSLLDAVDERCTVLFIDDASTDETLEIISVERSGLAFFGERPGGLLEVPGEIELQGGGLHCNLALELIHIPAAAADGCAHREWRVLRHFRGELVGDFERSARLKPSGNCVLMNRHVATILPIADTHLK
jgi:hypothetical protein